MRCSYYLRGSNRPLLPLPCAEVIRNLFRYSWPRYICLEEITLAEAV